jgi:putative aldouronate transport system permease protein
MSEALINQDILPVTKGNKYGEQNRISKAANIVLHLIFILGAAITIIPLWIVIAASLTQEQALVLNGYRFWPSEFSTMAYRFLFMSGGGGVVVAYRNTITATLLGTVLCTLTVGLYAYPLSRPDFKYRRLFTFISFFSMLFNAGTVAFYLLCSQILHINNTIFALFLPQSFSAFWVIIMRTFYKSNVPDSVIESARIDGAGEWRTLLQIVSPLALPGFATVALFAAVGVWNNFFNCMLLVNEKRFYNLQYTIYEILLSVQMLKEMAAQQGAAGSAGMVGLADLPSESFRMAMAVATMGPIVLAYPFFQRFFLKGLTIGAVKG